MTQNTIEITKNNFETKVLKSSLPIIIDFWATWCMPCKMIAPALDEIAEEYKGKVDIAKINVDDSPELVNEDPHGKGWILKMKIKDESELAKLMTASDYEQFLEGLED